MTELKRYKVALCMGGVQLIILAFLLYDICLDIYDPARGMALVALSGVCCGIALCNIAKVVKENLREQS